MVRKYLVLSLAFALVFSGCIGKQKVKEQSDSHFAAKVFEAETTGFGYDIYKDRAVMIHQPNVPGLPGNDGFRTKDDAEAVANLMITKLENGVMPPSITTQDLDSLKIKRD